MPPARAFLVLFATLRASATYSLVVSETGALASPNAHFVSLIDASRFASLPINSTCLPRAAYAAALAAAAPTWAAVLGADPAGGADFLTKLFEARTFRTAFTFMSAGAVLADVNDHHPLWTNVYNSVNVSLSTDDRKCVSTFDVALAQGLDVLWANFSCGEASCSSNGVCARVGAPCTCAPGWDGADCATAVAVPTPAAATPFLSTPAGVAAVAVPSSAAAVALIAMALAAWRRARGGAAAFGAPAAAPLVPSYGAAAKTEEDALLPTQMRQL
jgi:4a-hydroxytetrahydrobiopterin dehydratase